MSVGHGHHRHHPYHHYQRRAAANNEAAFFGGSLLLKEASHAAVLFEPGGQLWGLSTDTTYPNHALGGSPRHLLLSTKPNGGPPRVFTVCCALSMSAHGLLSAAGGPL